MFKRVLVVAVVAVLTMGYAQAQFKFGARAGLNLTSWYGSDVDDAKMKPGFQIGVVGDYSLSEAFAIQPGILFATQGYKLKEDDQTSTINLNYIQIPINAQYKIDLGGMKLLLQAGPYLGFGLGGKYKWDDGDVKIKFGDEEDEEDTWYIEKAFDFGLGLGAGLQFSNMQVGLGYNFGLTSLYSDSSTKNNGLALTFTYLFGK